MCPSQNSALKINKVNSYIRTKIKYLENENL